MAFADPGNPDELAAAIRDSFHRTYGVPALAVGRAPGRVNLIGEHTDYNAGLCLPVALPHSTYAAAAPRTDRRVRITSRQQPAPWEGSLDAIGPGRVTGWASYVAGVVWALGQAGHDVPGLNVYVDGTVPVGAGLSSSAALECSVAVAVLAVLGHDLDEGLRRDLVGVCIRAETEVAGAPTGGMDQTVSMLASPGAALLLDFESGSVREVPLGLGRAGLCLLVTDTGASHALVDGGYAARRADCEAAAAVLGVPSLRRAELAGVEALSQGRLRRRARHVVTEIGRVQAVVRALEEDDWDAVGRLFEQSHVSMRDDFEISCPELDAAVSTAREAGAVGARMTGGGFGGSCVAILAAHRVEAVARAIDVAFAARGFRAPTHLLAMPSARAQIMES